MKLRGVAPRDLKLEHDIAQLRYLSQEKKDSVEIVQGLRLLEDKKAGHVIAIRPSVFSTAKLDYEV